MRLQSADKSWVVSDKHNPARSDVVKKTPGLFRGEEKVPGASKRYRSVSVSASVLADSDQ